jgi:micrococcal nuclease
VIKSITDGDTIVCSDNTRVRLLLVDAPEKDQGDFGSVARAALLEMLPLGQVAELEFDVQRADRYGRTLAYVYRDGEQINRAMARKGWR